jgi:ribose-phosphate pyrophosphokinase
MVKFVENIRGRDVFIVQPTSAPANANLMELLIMTDALKRSSAKSITAVVPYYGYARQDRKAAPRVPISAKLVANLMETAGITRMVTVDLHASQIQGFFDIPSDHLTALPTLASYFLKKNLKKMTIVAPDTGSVKKVRRFAKIFDAPIAIVDKRRPKHNVAEVINVVGNVRGKTCIIWDDMIDTGGTVVAATQALIEKGAAEVYVCATHGILSGDAMAKLKKSKAKEIVVTNTVTIPEDKQINKIKVLSVASLLGEAISRIHDGRSLSILFDQIINKYLAERQDKRLINF